MHEPQGLIASAKMVAAVDFSFPLPPWQKDISGSPDRLNYRKDKDASGSPDRMDYWEEQGRLRQP
ncbi:hypothetical protein JW933_10380 [candidate division FCPU426 bacterium]|nr:hypothetical protein [candidate division FCPU426 bacterium]